MITADQLLKQGRRDEIWQKYCGFLDLTLQEFMAIQKELLQEQLEQLSRCDLGRRLLGSHPPKSVEAFREQVPLTTYQDYIPDLPEKRETVLPERPHIWARTSGRAGEYAVKWIPHSKRMVHRMGRTAVAAMILASCSRRGEVLLDKDDSVLLGLAPRPYMPGHSAHAMTEHFHPRLMPSLEAMEQMGSLEQGQLGFQQALENGMDYFNGPVSVLVREGRRFEQAQNGVWPNPGVLLRPTMAVRLLSGLIKAKLKGRPMRPCDLWALKGIMSSGIETNLYKDKIKQYWGRQPFEVYGCAEGGTLACQGWNYKGLTFLPDLNFLEFIPHSEHLKSKDDPAYQPATRLMDELGPGIYELVLTNFHGGSLARYRLGDLLEIISLRDEELGIDLPQATFYARADEIISLAGFTTLTERAIWQAIEDADIHYEDWTIRKEVWQEQPGLHLYLEPKPDQDYRVEEIQAAISRHLQQVDSNYKDLQAMYGFDPLRVTLLKPGAFQRYFEDRQRAGADLARLSLPHIQAPDDVIQRLQQFENS